MGYRTSNEESHVCIYCDILVEVGQGVLIKYTPAQSDESIMHSHFTNRIGHDKCVQLYGTIREQEALIQSWKYNKVVLESYGDAHYGRQ